MRYYTADYHFGHKNILKYENRPFKNIDIMDKELIKLTNSKLSPGDELYIIGDFGWFGSNRIHYYETLMNKFRDDVKYHLILGNHDKLNPFQYIDVGFTSVHTSLIVEVEGIKCLLNHDPCVYDIAQREGLFLIHGHVHSLYKHLIQINKEVLNVGVDVWDYKPVSEEKVKFYIDVYRSI